MKCMKCKMDIPKGAKVCPYCGSKQGMGCGVALVILLLLGGFVYFIQGVARDHSDESSNASGASSVVSEDPYAGVISTISSACKSVGIAPSQIVNVSQIENWENGEQYQFSYDGVKFTAALNSDGTVDGIYCGTNKMYDNGEAVIRYLKGFLVRTDSGTVEYGTCEVNGIVMNLTGADCSYVQIDVGFFGKDGVKITSGLDNVLNLKKGEQWRFKVYGFGDGITNYKIEDISWY